MSIVSKATLPSSGKNSVPVFSLSKLLEKCLSLTIFGEKNIVSSAVLLVDLVGGHAVKDKLKKLLFLGSQTRFTEEIALSSHKTVPLSEHERSIKNATEEFEHLKCKSNRHDSKNNIDQGNNNAWSVVKSWTPCPIGMVPCSFSSTAVLPSFYTGATTTVLDAKGVTAASEDRENTKANEEPLNNEMQHERNITQRAEEFVENTNTRAGKKPRQLLHGQEENSPEVKYPMKGMLLVDGVWKKVSEEELTLLQSATISKY
jgi:ribosomal biogenesis protein LAS1